MSGKGLIGGANGLQSCVDEAVPRSGSLSGVARNKRGPVAIATKISDAPASQRHEPHRLQLQQ